MQYLLLFLEGIITFISPCILPMIPIYISYFAAGERGKGRSVSNALGFVLGFTIIFTILGAFAGTIGSFLSEYRTIVNIISGIIVVLFGLNFMGIISVKPLNATRQISAKVRNLGFFSSMLFGIAFSVGWTPCVGALLGSALMMASQTGGVLAGISLLLAYSLGLGVPFVLSAVLIEQLKGSFDVIKRNFRAINTVSGLFLIIVGILMMMGILEKYLTLFA